MLSRATGRTPVKVRALEPGDLEFAAQLHARCLAHGLFPALGPRFLRAYLATFVTSPHAVGYLAEREGVPIGFLVGVLDARAHYGHVVRWRGLRLGAVGARCLVVRPRVAWWFARTRLRRYVRGSLRLARGSGTGAPAAQSVADAVLTHVAVSDDQRSSGAGAALVAQFTEAARDAGASTIRLVTRAGDDGAGLFYEKLGWHNEGTVADHDNLRWTRYRLSLA